MKYFVSILMDDWSSSVCAKMKRYSEYTLTLKSKAQNNAYNVTIYVKRKENICSVCVYVHTRVYIHRLWKDIYKRDKSD